MVDIWEGMNLPDVSNWMGFPPEEITNTIDTLKKYMEIREKNGTCPGCYFGGGPSKICGIANCVKSKGYWTCTECEDYDMNSLKPCPHIDVDANPKPVASRGEMSAAICKRYNSNTSENLKRCREIGYNAFIEEVKEKVDKGWRTWQVISKEMVFTKKEEAEEA